MEPLKVCKQPVVFADSHHIIKSKIRIKVKRGIESVCSATLAHIKTTYNENERKNSLTLPKTSLDCLPKSPKVGGAIAVQGM